MFTKIVDCITKAFFILASLALASIVVLYCTEIVMRYFFASPTSWAPDVITFLFCASLMLAMPEVTRENGHIAVSIILDFSSHGFANKLRVILYALSAVVMIYVFYITLMELLRLYENGINTLGSFRIRKWIVFAFIPLGIGLSAIQFLILLKQQVSETFLNKSGA
ncbi:TRAP transporter small permease subunit [Halomonas sp. KM007]